MNLKIKSLIIAIITTLFLVGITYMIFYLTYFGYIKNQRILKTADDFKVINTIIENEGNDLIAALEDWVYWDDTSAFIEDKNFEFVKNNLQNHSLDSLNINLALFYNAKDELVYTGDYKLDERASDSLIENISENLIRLHTPDDSSESKTGLLVFDDRAYFVGIADITDSLKVSPSNGTLVFVRNIDSGLIDYIKRTLGVAIRFRSVGIMEPPNGTTIEDPILHSMETSNVIKDINGNDTIVLTMLRPDPNYSGIRYYFNIFVVSFILLLLAIFLADLMIVDKYFFKRISKLTQFVNNVATSKDTTKFIEINGNDEFTKLASSMNNMLSALDAANKDISQMDGRYRLLMETTNDGFLDYNVKTDEMYISPEWKMLIGYDGESCTSLSHDYMSKIHLDCYEKVIGALKDVLSGKAEYFEAEYRVITATGTIIWVQHRGKTVEKDENNRPIRIISTLQNITTRKKHEEEILYLSYSDKLTGLRNRTYMEDRFDELDQNPNSSYFIIMGDLNGLMLTNEAFGHAAGDKLLAYAGEILKNLCSPNDIISRWGGDEFIILVKDAAEVSIVFLINKIRTSLKKIDHFHFSVTMALGYANKTENHPTASSVMNLAEKRMFRNKLMEHSSSRSAAIESLVKTLHEKNSETEEHTMRIKILSTKLAEKLGLPQDKLDELGLLSLLHDIGKIGIPDLILLKPSKLTDEEWTLMKTHTEIGYRIAKSTPELEHIAEEILAHHEKFDGTGYPKGLKGDEIPFLSRIINVVDSYDVMTHSRVYKDASNNSYALSELIRCSGTQFDPYIAKMFIQLLEEEETLLNELLHA